MLLGSTWVRGVLTWGPPSTWMMLSRLMAYSSACRTLRSAIALLLLGERWLNQMYGFDESVAPRWSSGSLLAMSWESCEGGGKLLNSMSAFAVPVCSCCWVDSW